MAHKKLKYSVFFFLFLMLGGNFGYLLLPKIPLQNTGIFENDVPPNLKGADEYIIPQPISKHLWSPDGTKLAYIKFPSGQTWNGDIWIADKSPNSAQLINHQLIFTGTEGLSAADFFDWKDNWLLIMIRFEEGTPSSYYGRGELWKIRTNGTDLTQLTFTNTNGIRTTWSNSAYTNVGTALWGRFIPGTNKIYFKAHNGNGWYKSFVCNDDGTDGWYHISNPDYAFYTAISPTGNKLLWGHATYWNNPTTLRSSNVDGSERFTIKAFSYTLISDGSTMLADGSTFIWNKDDNIYAIGMDGTNERTVIDDGYINDAWNYNPVNSQGLIITSTRLDGNRHLFKMNVDGSDIVQLTDASPYHDDAPIMCSNGQYVSYLRLPYNFDTSNPRPWPYDLVVKSLIPTPIITINSPESADFFASNSPNYDITISGDYNKIWYTLDNGITNITITELTGTINQLEWDKLGDGVVPLRFYANNSLGNSSYSEVIIHKDTIIPTITLNSPFESEIFGKTSPFYDLTIVELNLNSMWYSLDQGITNISFQELTGTIDQTEWNKKGNGTVTIIFYAKDEAGNQGSAQVIVRKEATPPLITIISPIYNDLFHIIAPTFEISIEEIDLNSTWYSLDDGITNLLFTGLTGSIDQAEWDKFGNGTINLKFYANDSYGFENFAVVLIHKDINGPLITINSPQLNDGFSSGAPGYDITVIDLQLDTMWYTIDGGVTNFSIGSTIGTIDQTEWNKIGNEHVTIRFYANDTLGNTAFSEVQVIKDTINPVITIINPDQFDLYGNTPPSFDLSIVEQNLDSMWYSLDGGITNTTFQELTGTINQNEWDKCGNGTITIQFYASDLVGNIGSSQVVVLKDIIAPTISINSPNVADIFEHTAPTFSLSIVESNLDLVWYTLDDGITNFSIVALSGTIDQSEWNKFGNGTITLKFYARDLVGNEGMSQIIIRKDIAAPTITINLPQQDEKISSIAPAYDITVIDSQLDSMWYTIDNGLTNISIVSTIGTINQMEWDKLEGGSVSIRFYANDTLGNTAYSEVVIIKDIFFGMDPIELFTPSAYSQIFSNFINFSWSSVDAGFGVVNFTLQVSNVTNFSHVIFQSGDIAETSIVTNFSVSLTITQGQYFWRVRPTYGNYNGSWSDYSSFTLHVNDYAPNLVLDDISPTDGTSSTIFRFTVIYSDLDNNPPEYVEILINGISYSMGLADLLDDDFTDGCVYQYLTLLVPSTTAYTISFECSDGTFQYSTSTYQGPLVESDSTPSNNQGNDNFNSANMFAIMMTLGITVGSIIPFIAFAEIKASKIKKLDQKTSTKIKKKELES